MNEFEKAKIEVICSHAYELCKTGKLSYEEFASMSLEDLAKRLDAILSEKPKHGEWISKVASRSGDYLGWKCSNCGYFTGNSEAGFYNYCPDCGAKMESD